MKKFEFFFSEISIPFDDGLRQYLGCKIFQINNFYGAE
jgi:hypothetical protein